MYVQPNHYKTENECVTVINHYLFIIIQDICWYMECFSQSSDGRAPKAFPVSPVNVGALTVSLGLKKLFSTPHRIIQD